MKTWSLLLLLLSLIAMNAAARAAVAADPIEQAVFANDPRITMPQAAGTRTVGVVAFGPNGWGVAYSQVLQRDRNAWAQANYSPKNYVFTDSSKPMVDGYAELLETSRIQLLTGVDETFHLTKNKYWGFVLGLSVGLNQSKYDETYYPGKCFPSYCIFNPNKPSNKNSTDTYAFLGGRMGVAIRETKIMGVKGDVVITLNPILQRTGEDHKFRTPTGAEVPVGKLLKYSLEAMIEI